MLLNNARADVVANLACRDEQDEGPALAVADSVQLGVHAVLGSADQASTPPFSRPCWSLFGEP